MFCSPRDFLRMRKDESRKLKPEVSGDESRDDAKGLATLKTKWCDLLTLAMTK